MQLTKHHGLGNDFLVLLDLDSHHTVDGELARALCDRHRGIGADGLIHATAGTDDADVTFRLYNADGSEAEMSGNGISCLAQAVVDRGSVTGREVRVATAAGTRRVLVNRESAPGRRAAFVAMPLPAMSGDRFVDMGNPHEVVLVDDVEQLRKLELAGPSDRNVEYVVVNGGKELTMRVVERGVGETLACGTGACAAVVATTSWGLVGGSAVVHQPGGDAAVVIDGDTLTYSVEVQFIARIEVPWR